MMRLIDWLLARAPRERLLLALERGVADAEVARLAPIDARHLDEVEVQRDVVEHRLRHGEGEGRS